MQKNKNNFYLSLLLIFISGCNTQYLQKDYSFYDKNFDLEPASLLRSDGVYVNQAKQKIYKFYKSGQANLVLDLNNELKIPQDYIQAFNGRIIENHSKKKATLFERYYRLEGNKLVMQAVNEPRKQFYYEYALLEKNSLIIVKSTIRGKGKIKDKYYTDYYKEYYTDYYKEYYRFIPTGETGYLSPNW